MVVYKTISVWLCTPNVLIHLYTEHVNFAVCVVVYWIGDVNIDCGRQKQFSISRQEKLTELWILLLTTETYVRIIVQYCQPEVLCMFQVFQGLHLASWVRDSVRANSEVWRSPCCRLLSCSWDLVGLDMWSTMWTLPLSKWTFDAPSIG